MPQQYLFYVMKYSVKGLVSWCTELSVQRKAVLAFGTSYSNRYWWYVCWFSW